MAGKDFDMALSFDKFAYLRRATYDSLYRGEPMSIQLEQNKALVRRMLDEIW
jgi:hypothetical protein